MLECINNQCDDCKEFKCTREICSERINPDHTPNYAEEQLEYAKENKTNLMEQVKKCVNYEEEYFELLKENEKLKATNKGLVEEIKDKNINYQVNIEELHEEIDQVMEEKEKLNNSLVLLQSENDEYIQALEKVRAENEEYKQINKNLSKELKSSDITNRNMKTEINNLNQLIEKKDIKIEKLEKEIDSLKEVVNEGNEQLTNEYSNKIIIAEQRINSLNTEVACLKAFKEKDNKQIQNLKDTIKSMAAAL